MKDIMEKHTIINLKRNGDSNRAVERKTGINRKTVAKYWNEYVEQSKLLNDGLTDNISEIQEAMVSAPKYDSSTRGSRKYTDQMDQRLNQILSQEERKDRLLGPNKQKLTKLQIHQFLVEDGYDIGYSTIAVKISEKLNKNKECFIRQLYDLGDRLE